MQKNHRVFLQPTLIRLRKVKNPQILINIDCRQVTYQIDAICVNFSKIIILRSKEVTEGHFHIYGHFGSNLKIDANYAKPISK